MTGFQSKRQASKNLLQPAMPNTWREAIDGELVCLHLGTVDSFPDARAALNALINWHVEVALDPAVSAYAQALIDRGAAAPVPQAEPVHQFRKIGCSDWYDMYPDEQDGNGPYETRTLYTHPPAQPAPVPAVPPEVTREWVRDLVKESGLDWHRGFAPLFDGDDTNRYEVLVRAALAAAPVPAADNSALRKVVEGAAAADEFLENPGAIYRLARMARAALKTAEAALADIGDSDREPGDDLAWCEARAAQALPAVRAALKGTT